MPLPRHLHRRKSRSVWLRPSRMGRFMGCTRFSDELADLKHVPRQQSQARSTARFAIAADRPFAGTKTQRLKQNATGIVMKRVAGAFGDQPAKERGGATAIGPFRAG